MPFFNDFPSLEKLSMSAWDVMRDETPSNAFQKLAAPRLRYLYLDFCVEDQHNERVEDFKAEQVNWLREFASLKKESSGSKLVELHISFSPHSRCSIGEDEVIPQWPWEYVEQARHAIAEYGMTLEYEESSNYFHSREEWNRIAQEQLDWMRKRKSRKVRKRYLLEYWQPGTFDPRFEYSSNDEDINSMSDGDSLT
jgi:hypothetical protein